KRKGCRQLLDAFAAIAPILPDLKLIIAGDGPERQSLEKQVLKLNLSDRVKFLGYISESQKPQLLSSATIACFPSLYGEAFGIVLIEAMAAKAQVVLGGDNPGYRSVLGKRDGLLINPRDIKAFTNRLLILLSDDKLRRELHDWQSNEVKKYDIAVVGQQIYDVYIEAIARLNKKRHNKTHG
ncbi:glycosyltransferase, partial [Candidatus Saccharibacteria bacterium]|nr:glycosyltransferase [Candidatus Saccharibacteria bacterium]